MQAIWSSWLWVTLAIPIFYAIDCLLDVFFVDKKLYRNPIHASVISGLFCGILIILILPNHDQISIPDFNISMLALSCGIFYFLHVYFYFNALFKLNDASNIEMYLGFSVVLVPVLAFVLLNEKLHSNHYTGIALAFTGIVILTYSSVSRNRFTSTLTAMSGAIIMLSITYVIQDYVFGYINFHTGLMFFILGKAIAAIFLWLGSNCKHIVTDIKKYWPSFIVIQLSGLMAIVVSLRAIEISPYLTLIVLFESAAPIFIILFSVMLLPFFRNSNPQHSSSICVLREQLVNFPMKFIAFAFLTCGIIFATLESIDLTTITKFQNLSDISNNRNTFVQ